MGVSDSEVYENGWEGVSVFANSVATITTSKIRANRFSGFRIRAAIAGIDDCDILDNAQAGVDVGDTGRVTIDNSRINNNATRHSGLLTARMLPQESITTFQTAVYLAGNNTAI